MHKEIFFRKYLGNFFENREKKCSKYSFRPIFKKIMHMFQTILGFFLVLRKFMFEKMFDNFSRTFIVEFFFFNFF